MFYGAVGLVLQSRLIEVALNLSNSVTSSVETQNTS